MNWNSNTLILLSYNNYYNRIVKKENSLEDYLEYEILGTRLSATNFNPNDGVNTTHIVNIPDNTYPDYLIVLDEENQINSRWFIIESNRIRGGQYSLTLHRDLMVDYYEDVVNAPCFIEKATLDINDPLIFNEEDMSFNQIKNAEYLLQDKYDCPWIIGYYAKDTPAENLSGTVKKNDLDNSKVATLSVPIDSWEWNYTNKDFYVYPSTIEYNIYAEKFLPGGITNKDGYAKFNSNGTYIGWEQEKNLNTPLSFNNNYATAVANIEDKFEGRIALVNTSIKGYLTKYKTESEFSTFYSYNGTIVQDGDGRFFKITLNQSNTYNDLIDITSGSLFTMLSQIVNVEPVTGTPDSTSFKMRAQGVTYRMSIEELFDQETQWDMTGIKTETEDAPYNIFAIPYGKITLANGNTSFVEAVSNKDIGLLTATSIINKMVPDEGGGFLYDIQLLPYCPLEISAGAIFLKDPKSYSFITAAPETEGGERKKVGFILHIPFANFNKTFDVRSDFYKYRGKNALERKVNNQCDKFRLCSPNFNGYFDFSSEKNNGIERFLVDCSYKPYQPYIHVNPDFKNLYGKDFNDARGLICGGDFSLSQVTNQWQSYQIQNKNYQEMFDRQIQNLEVSNKYQKELDKWTAVAGTVSGVVSGGAAGAMTFGGNPYAMVGGAIGGGIVSGLAGARDREINQALRNEAIDYTKDNFGYNLCNIQALPNILTKVSSFNENNKIFPFVEYYTCTDREKAAFREKLKYNGMTVMAIGTISDYLQLEPSYIKGKIIRLPEINEDFHIANELAKEVNLGIFI